MIYNIKINIIINLNIRKVLFCQDEISVRISAYPEKQLTTIVTKINKKPDFATKRATSNNGEFDIISIEAMTS